MDAIKKQEHSIAVKKRDYNSAKKTQSKVSHEIQKPVDSTMDGLNALGAMGAATVAMSKNSIKFTPDDLNKIAVIARDENFSHEQIKAFKKCMLDLMKKHDFNTLNEIQEWYTSPKSDTNELAIESEKLDKALGMDILVDGGYTGYPFTFAPWQEENI